MDYKQLIELDGYINLWEVLPEDKHSKIAKQIWKALDEEGITLTNEAELEIRIYDGRKINELRTTQSKYGI